MAKIFKEDDDLFSNIEQIEQEEQQKQMQNLAKRAGRSGISGSGGENDIKGISIDQIIGGKEEPEKRDFDDIMKQVDSKY